MFTTFKIGSGSKDLNMVSFFQNHNSMIFTRKFVWRRLGHIIQSFMCGNHLGYHRHRQKPHLHRRRQSPHLFVFIQGFAISVVLETSPSTPMQSMAPTCQLIRDYQACSFTPTTMNLHLRFHLHTATDH